MQKAKRDPHLVLNALTEAGRVADGRIAVVRVRMEWKRGEGVLGRMGIAGKAADFLRAHLIMAAQAWRNADADLIVVREFITGVMPAAWPLIRPLRRKLCFVVNHNLQEAHERPRERRILRALYRSGMRFLSFESMEGWDGIGVTPRADRILVVPFPVDVPVPPRVNEDPDRVPVIGVIGEMRREKGSREVVDRLLALTRSGRLEARILIGSPTSDPSIVPGPDVEFIDTSERSDYLRALDRCDIVVLNYQPIRYLYRSSGVVAEAVARRAIVVAPDFPIMRRQVNEPEPVGVLFRDLEDLERALHEAIDLMRSGSPHAWDAHGTARSARAVAERYDAFIRGQDTPLPAGAAVACREVAAR